MVYGEGKYVVDCAGVRYLYTNYREAKKAARDMSLGGGNVCVKEFINEHGECDWLYQAVNGKGKSLYLY